MYEVGQPFFYIIRRNCSSQRPEKKAEKVERRQLGRKGLGRGHTDLRTGMGIDYAVGFPAGRGAHHITDGDDCCASLLCLTHGCERICRFTGLGDGDEQVVLAHERAAVSELRCDVHLGRDGGELLEHVLAYEPGMPGCTAGDDVYLFHSWELLP